MTMRLSQRPMNLKKNIPQTKHSKNDLIKDNLYMKNTVSLAFFEA